MSEQREEGSTPTLGQELDTPQLETRGEEPLAFQPVGFFDRSVRGRVSCSE